MFRSKDLLQGAALFLAKVTLISEYFKNVTLERNSVAS